MEVDRRFVRWVDDEPVDCGRFSAQSTIFEFRDVLDGVEFGLAVAVTGVVDELSDWQFGECVGAMGQYVLEHGT